VEGPTYFFLFPDHFLDTVYLFELSDNGMNVIYVVNIKLDMTFKNPFYSLNGNFADIDTQLS
jgi:hypothetical protein